MSLLTQLNGLDYHWLWGIRYKKSPEQGNVGSAINTLCSDVTRREAMQAAQLAIYEKPAFIRFFYWLFNMNNYSYNGYVLAAYQAYTSNLSQNSKDNTTMIQQGAMAVVGLGVATVGAIAYFGKGILRVLTGTGVREHNQSTQRSLVLLGAANAPVQRAAGTIKQDAIMISSEMMPYLIVLDINLEIGRTLSRTHFRSICRARWLRTHRDTGGSDEAFLRANSAIQSLNAFFNRQDKDALNSNYWPDFMDDLLTSIERRLDGVEACLDRIGEMRREISELTERTHESAQRTAEINRDTSERIEHCKELMRQVQEKRALEVANRPASPSAGSDSSELDSDVDDSKEDDLNPGTAP